MNNGIITLTIKPGDGGTSPAAPNPHSLLGGTRMSDSKDTIPYGFCHCGCGQKTTISPKKSVKFGYAEGEPRAYVHGHYGRVFHSAYIVNPETNCWEWQKLNSAGYGRVFVDGKMRPAHRHIYEKIKGHIPNGLQLDHTCRNRCCVNPDHLEPVTAKENVRRSSVTKLSDDDVRQIRLLKGKMTNVDIGKMFGVSDCHVAAIILRRKRGDDV